ncbi:hypothetical protein [Desertivirga xinjiangensis]|uniref:hypothetical protein n=1 Tax=Desertivirga xinjiangensis TaxID=539206 RepID=UPI00210CAC9D|nr:hypothetical protein [Pedobacter xinjiangensis]
MKNILIPTDFSANAFDCIPSLCSQFKGQDLHLCFIHLFKLSDSINELLLLSRRSKEYEHVKDSFYTECEKLKKEYQEIRSIKIDFFYGSTLGQFKNYLAANEIDFILHPADCSTSKLNKTSIDPSILTDRCDTPLLRVQKEKQLVHTLQTEKTSEVEILAEA